MMALARLYGFKFRRVEPEQVDREVFNKLELNYIKGNRIMPVARKKSLLKMSGPINLKDIKKIEKIYI